MATIPVRIRRGVRPVIPIKVEVPPPPQPSKAIKAYVAAELDSSTPRVDYNAVIERYTSKIANRATAIRAFCVQCCCGVLSEVRNCTVTGCALYEFRNGSDPFRKKRSDGFVGKQSDDGEEE